MNFFVRTMIFLKKKGKKGKSIKKQDFLSSTIVVKLTISPKRHSCKLAADENFMVNESLKEEKERESLFKIGTQFDIAQLAFAA